MQDSDQRTRRQRNLAWLALIAWSAVVWYFSVRPTVPETSRDGLNRVMWQGGHLVIHGVLGYLAGRAAWFTWGLPRGFAFAVPAAVLHAIADETVQIWLPTRRANMEDVLYNVAGVLLPLAILWWLNRRRRTETRTSLLRHT